MKTKKVFGSRKLLPFYSFALILVMSFGLAGCAKAGEGAPDTTDATKQDVIIDTPKASSADLYCLEFNTFSGIYVEDGKNKEVENVATILVENRSEIFLDRATIKYKYGDKTATFLVTGLPAKGKCWVMEANRLQIDGKHSFEFEDCISAFKEDATLGEGKIKTSAKGNTLTVTNILDKTLNNVCVYYKNTMDDGNFLGGITYMLTFDTLKPGESLEKASGHYSENSKIVRCSFQE